GFFTATDAQPVADMQRPRRLACRIVDIDLPVPDRLLGERPGLEEPRRPQPRIDAYTSLFRTHAFSVASSVAGRPCATASPVCASGIATSGIASHSSALM